MNAHRLRSLLRRELIISITILCLFLLVAVCGFSYSRAQSSEGNGRELVEKIPKHLPIKVKVKKPEKLKDAKNEDWLDDMEVEVTNTGTKPIYFLLLHLDLPDVLAPDGENYIFMYKYGRVDLAAFEEPVRPDDVPLQPGETVTLKDTDNVIRGWKRLRKNGEVTNPKKLDLVFQLINFGDGTGFMGRSGTSIPVRKRRSSNAPRAGEGESVRQTVGAANSPPRVFPDSAYISKSSTPPVSFLPAVYSSRASAPEPAAKPDICCDTGRSDCWWIKPGGQTCICGEITVMQFPACSDLFAACFTIKYGKRSCADSTGFKHTCETSDYGSSCDSTDPDPDPDPDPSPDPDPDPTSTPPPTPMPCQGPKPADCCVCGDPPPGTVGIPRSWECAGPCPNGTDVGGGCKTTKSPDCPDGFSYSPIYGGICCPATPTPSPTPTPAQTAEACQALGLFWDAVGGPGYGGQCVDEDACNNDGLFWTFLPGNTTQHTCRGLYGGDPENCVEQTFYCGHIVPETNCPYNYITNNVCFSPVLIDTAGDGLKLSDATHGVYFDLDGNPDHVKEHLSWPVGADDAWLALDRNRNGVIDSGRELFGNVTPQQMTGRRGGEGNGFNALASFDTARMNGNQDGVIDARDGFWRYLRLWIDKNRDGVSQAAELHPLEEYDIVRLHFDDKESKRTDQYGNQFRYRAKVDDAKGAKVNRWAWDVFLVSGQ